MALGSITEGPDKQKFLEIIFQAFANLLQMFKDPNCKVREAISWVMSRICEHHADVLINPQIINQFMHCILESVGDKPRISNQCCNALSKLAASIEPATSEELTTNALSPFFGQILQILIANTAREDFHGTGIDLIQSSYVALTALVQSSSKDQADMVYQLMIPILQKLEASLAGGPSEKANHLQDLLCGLL